MGTDGRWNGANSLIGQCAVAKGPVGAAKFAVEDTSTDGPIVAATPGVTARGPKTDAGFP